MRAFGLSLALLCAIQLSSLFNPAFAKKAACPVAAPFDLLGGLAEIGCTIGLYAPFIAAETGLEALMPSIASGEAHNGHLHFPFHLEKEPGFLHTRNPNESYGTLELWWALKTAGWKIALQHPGGFEFVVGDISKEQGGKLKPHHSHQHGRDVDLRLFQHGFEQVDETGAYPYVYPGAENIDFEREWALLEHFYDTRLAAVVLMDKKLQKMIYNAMKDRVPAEKLSAVLSYTKGKSEGSGLVKHAKGHYNHIHVRFHASLSRLLGLLWDDEALSKLEREMEIRRYGRFEITIQSGDILGSLARKHHVTVDDLLKWNHLTEKSILHPGQKLFIYQRIQNDGEMPAGEGSTP